MSASIADEISKLHQLLTAGILTAEEFAEAKKGLIASMMMAPKAPFAPAATTTSNRTALPSVSAAPTESASAAAASAAAAAVPPSMPSSATTTQVFPPSTSTSLAASSFASVVDTSLFDVSHIGAHDVVYQHLSTIFSNIANNPRDPKYRRLRRSNPKLSAELFTSSAAERLLASVGFVDALADDGAEFFMLPLNNSSSVDTLMTSAVSVDDGLVERQIVLIRRAIGEIQSLRQRDASAAAEAVNAAKLLRSVALDIRHEQCKRALSDPSSVAANVLSRKYQQQLQTLSSSSAASSSASSVAPPVSLLPPHLSRLPPFNAFLASLFLAGDDISDGLAVENVKKLIQVEEKALGALKIAQRQVLNNNNDSASATEMKQANLFDDAQRKVLRLPLANVNASKLVLGQKGAVETLIEMGGWSLRATPSVGSNAVSVMWAPAAASGIVEGGQSIAAAGGSSSLLASGVPFDLVMMVRLVQSNGETSFVPLHAIADDDAMNAEQKQEGVPLADQLAALFTKTEDTIALLTFVLQMLVDHNRMVAMREREAAIAAAKAEMQKGIVEEKRAKEQKIAELKRQMAAADGNPCGSSSDDDFDEDGTATKKQKSSRLRVKTEDAIKYLMGKESKEDVMLRARQAMEKANEMASRPTAATAKSRLLTNNGAGSATSAQQTESRGVADLLLGGGANGSVDRALQLAVANDNDGGDFDSDWSN